MIRRFTGFRRALSELVEAGTVQHTAYQRNPDDAPQYEGVIWSDGSCTLRWRTAGASTSVFPSFEGMIKIHGHPEYGTEIVFHDGEPPAVWIETLRAYGMKLAEESEGRLVFCDVREKRDPSASVAIYVEYADHTGVFRVLYGC